jgi:hypothetical protein
VFVEDWILDRGPEASWIAATNLSARLGLSVSMVEKHRRALLALGFYFVVRRPGCKSDGWVPTLPLGCRHRGTSVDDIQATARRIEALVRGELFAIEAKGTPDGGSRPTASGVFEPTARGALIPTAQGAMRTGGPSLIEVQLRKQPLALPQDRTRVGASAPKAEQEGDDLEPLTPRAIDQRPADEVTDEGFAAIAKIRQRQAEARKAASL